MKVANRLNMLPPYLFSELEAKAAGIRAQGIDLIDLGIADPDLKPPQFLLDAVISHLDDPDAHQYPTSRGDPGVRRAIARWFNSRFGVSLDPEREIVVVLGGKGGLSNLARAFVDPGDEVGVPEPGYPVYGGAGAALNEAYLRPLILDSNSGFLPNLKDAIGTKILFLNYPNNPTGAIAPESFYEETAYFAESHPETLVAWDAAYSELTFDGIKTPSILQFTQKAVEIHSLSKMMNCTGFRIGFAAGNAAALDALVRVKTQVDSGAPVFIQRAMANALGHYEGKIPPPECRISHSEYGKRKDLLEKGLQQVKGIERVYSSPATFFVWAAVEDDLAFVEKAMNKGVIFTPGRGFGLPGMGFIRASVTTPMDKIEEAISRISD
ncbi:MAG: aminotransferase class I/II-fold pyridoxal phosphate-dependent enzyme [Candidatus Electryonea clarkiae]|nr:aminotransferase class I/II-fold pyridoxal phosphate-dependent enzyme [Candidatus Electryonea clarkiae]MDP8286950.1 aminotransferase class I/II-fold pyridoxal phosphate-dependent enzyme [Candidatus Electryonea clarkiae]